MELAPARTRHSFRAVRPRTILVLEDLEDLEPAVATPPVPGAVVMHGGGYAVDQLAGIRWLLDARVLYWGDLDSHGFAIVDRFPGTCPEPESAPMDRVIRGCRRRPDAAPLDPVVVAAVSRPAWPRPGTGR